MGGEYKGRIVSCMQVKYFTVRVLANPCSKHNTLPENVNLLFQYITAADASRLNIWTCQKR